jgi:predicted MFS family arabinose efflux permease
VIRDKYRGRAVGIVQTGWSIGWGAAALLYTFFFAIMPEAIAWKAMFWIGLAPALLVFWIRRYVEEPEVNARRAEKVGFTHLFAAMKTPHLSITVRLSFMLIGAQGGGWAVGTFLPTYLKTVREMTSVGTGGYLLVLILGAFCGFVSGAYFADMIGRKKTFMISAVGSIVLVLVYLYAPLSNEWILPVGFLLGYIDLMKWSPMGSFMTELFPTSVRGVAQGFCYNVGRGIGALFPALVGILADRWGLGNAIAVFGVSGLAMMILALMTLPETRGRSLDSSEQLAPA